MKPFLLNVWISLIFSDCGLYILVALVEEVYFAQRERDEAIMSRLHLANKERDEAIARAQRMEMSLKEYVHFKNYIGNIYKVYALCYSYIF